MTTEHDPTDLSRRVEALEDNARKIGLYVDKTDLVPLPDGNTGVFIEFMIGNVAFTKRVQDPVQEQFDKQFREIESALTNDFLDQREAIKRRLEAGGSIFDKGDNNELPPT